MKTGRRAELYWKGEKILQLKMKEEKVNWVRYWKKKNIPIDKK